ncbi:hypothetical protein, partial [Kosmotoga arenicorallina]|uniref:hypothetical protein n=1 Tax=Kosmotoga arenicorallina TaxID=688066 RepID=UPI0012903D62
MKKILVMLLVLSAAVLLFPNSLKTLVPSMDEQSTFIALTFTSTISEFDYEFEANPSKTIYSLTLHGVKGKNMDLPLRAGPVEGLWTRDLGDRYTISVALLVPAKKEPDILVQENSITLRFWRSNIKVTVDRFSTFGMKLGSAIAYLMSDEILDLSYVITPSVKDLQLNIGFTATYPEDVIRNIFISLGDEISYAYFTDGTLYIGTPDEVKKVVNAFWKIYTGVDIEQGVDLETLRAALPVSAFLEYIPNESTILAFGDLETHMLISRLLTSAYVKAEYVVEESLKELFNNFLDIAQKVNDALFDGKISITSVPELNRFVLAGDKRNVERLKEYLDNYAGTKKSEAEKSMLKELTVTLPENFRIVEDVLTKDNAIAIKTSETATSTQLPAGTVSLVDSIVELLKGYIPEELIHVDRTFETLGKVTFRIPEAYIELLKEIVSDISIKAQSIGYRIIQAKYIDPLIVEHVQNLTSVKIEVLGERGGYIIKGIKRNIDVAEYLISEFSGGTPDNVEGKFIQLKSSKDFDVVQSFLQKAFQKKGFDPEDYAVESIAGRLVYIEAPSAVLKSVLEELGRYERELFSDALEEFIELPVSVYEGGIDQLLDAMFKEQVDYTYINSAELLIVRGSKEDIDRVKGFISKIRPGIEGRLKASETTGQRTSVFISAIPGWDVEKFKTYFQDFLGEEVFSSVKVITADAGYYVIATRNVTESITDEVKRLREIESPYYSTVENIPPVQELIGLFDNLGISVNILPVENKYIIVGSRDNVLKAQSLLNQIQSGYAKTSSATQTAQQSMLYEFVDISEDSISDFQSILNKLGISVELVKSPTGILAIGFPDALDRARSTINDISRRHIEEKDKVSERYAVLHKIPGVDLEALKSLVLSFSYNISLVPVADSIVAIGTEDDIKAFLSLYQELSSTDKSFAFVEKKLSFQEIQNIIDTFELQLKLLEVPGNFVVYGEPSSINTLMRLVDRVTSEAPATEITTAESTPATSVIKEARVITSPVSASVLSEIIKELGLDISLHEADSGLVATGEASQLEKLQSLLNSLKGLPEIPESKYALIPPSSQYSAEQLEEQLRSLQLNVSVFDSYPFGLILIGPAYDVDRAVQFVDYLKRYEKTRTEIYELPPSVTYENVETLLESTGFNLTLSSVGNAIVITGKEEDVAIALSLLSNLAKKIEKTGFTYKLLSIPLGISVVELEKTLNKLGYDVSLMDFAGSIVVLGTPESVNGAEKFIDYITPEDTSAATATEEPRGHSFVELPAGYSAEDLQTILRKIGINVDVVVVGDTGVMVGTASELGRGQEVLETLKKLKAKP